MNSTRMTNVSYCSLNSGNQTTDEMMKLHVILAIVFFEVTSGKTRHTWPPWVEPCKDSLPFDGSIVPDCRLYVDPDKPEHHFLQHSTSKEMPV